MDDIKLTYDPLDVSAISSFVTHPLTGATSVFIGTTRDNFEGKKVLRLEYEAFESMAVKELGKVVAEVRDKWEVHAVAIHHRLGVVNVTEASVVIAVSSPHRKEALEAVHFAIDKLKATVPIWKKEIYDEGETAWKENKECGWREGSSASAGAKANDNIENKEIDNNPKKMALVESSLVQVTASKGEIDRRIQAFIERKRTAINRTNIQEFCNRHSSEPVENSCARVDAVVVRKTDSKSHLRQSTANNEWGPLMGHQHHHHHHHNHVKKRKLDTIVKAEASSDTENKLPEGLEERMGQMEAQVRPNRPVPKGIYARLKQLEDRILYLEGISPEYKGLLKSKCKCEIRSSKDMVNVRLEEGGRKQQITQSLTTINSRINHLKAMLKLKGIKQEPI